jgi:glycosyltransferase involved in cell wall biosynthesis
VGAGITSYSLPIPSCWRVHLIMKNSLKNSVLLHLSHTDILSDNRILKELRALEVLPNRSVMAIGVKSAEEAAATQVHLKAKIFSMRLMTKGVRFVPRAVRYAMNLCELTIRMLGVAVKQRPAVVHCHDTLVLPAGFLIKLICGSQLVYDAHELESDKNGQSGILSKGTLLLEKICWSRIDLLVSVSPSILRWYTDNLGVKKNILVLNSPEVDLNCHHLDYGVQESGRRYFHACFQIPEDKLVFVYLGLLATGRGIEMVLEAFAQPNIKSHVVFIGYGDLKNKIDDYAKKHRNIHRHPPVPHEQVVGLVNNADVGLCLVENVSLSDFYCLPNKLFEYAFAGLPVLASDFPDIRKVVADYSLGICSDLKFEEIARVIGTQENTFSLKVDVDLSELSWPTQAKRLTSAYREMLNRRS